MFYDHDKPMTIEQRARFEEEQRRQNDEIDADIRARIRYSGPRLVVNHGRTPVEKIRLKSKIKTF